MEVVVTCLLKYYLSLMESISLRNAVGVLS